MTGIDALRRALAGPFRDGEIRVASVPAPRGEAERILALEARGPACFWDSGDTVMAGAGAAAVVRGSGPDRVAEVAAAADRLWPRIRVIGAAGPASPIVRLIGGFSFLPGPQPAPWSGFGEAAFMLPRALYVGTPGDSRLVVAVDADEVRARGIDPTLDLAAAALEALADPASGEAPGEGGSGDGRSREGSADGRPDSRDWQRAIDSIRAMIDEGRAEKIVAARAVEIRLDPAPSPATVLRRLRRAGPGTRFALRFDDAAFLGVTPERLVARQGRSVQSEALAGTAGVDDAGGAGVEDARLRTSAKDRAEHDFVVRAVAETLAPLCEWLDHPREPTVRRVANALHLHTPFEGRLGEPVPVLDLVARLHPTPAVGGTPCAAALDWIAREEGTRRGWYASPVGWLDASGDGDFVVALRSAILVAGRAVLYAGAGIVRDSDAVAELRETEVKLRTMQDALQG